VQLAVCANVASLLLSRALARKRETALRAALGAGAVAAARPLLLEGLALALLGGVLGVAVAQGLVVGARALVPLELPAWMRVVVDVRALLFALAAGAVTGLLTLLVPARDAARLDLAVVLREGSGASAARGRQRMRRTLVAGQIAASLVLVVSAALLARALVRLHEAPLGFEPRGLLTIQVDPPWSRFQKVEQTAPFYKRVLEEIQTLPGVRSAATNDALPLVDDAGTEAEVTLGIEGQSADEARRNPFVTVQAVSPSYFETMSVRMMRGRAFDAREGADHPPLAVVSRRFATRFFEERDPIGRRIRFGERGANFRPGQMDEAPVGPWLEIVGVAADVPRRSPAGTPGLDVYISDLQHFVPETFLLVRTQGDPRALERPVREAVLRVDPQQPLFDSAPMSDRVRATIWPQRLSGTAVSLFALFALVLAAVGLYGLLALLVAQRSREIAVRVAIGAGTRDVIRLVVGEAAAAIATGVGVGALAAVAVARALQSFAGVSPADLWLAVPVALLLGVTAAAAAFLPARRALAVDPRQALRAE
jgi:putative ABC transport system permease protein